MKYYTTLIYPQRMVTTTQKLPNSPRIFEIMRRNLASCWSHQDRRLLCVYRKPLLTLSPRTSQEVKHEVSVEGGLQSNSLTSMICIFVPTGAMFRPAFHTVDHELSNNLQGEIVGSELLDFTKFGTNSARPRKCFWCRLQEGVHPRCPHSEEMASSVSLLSTIVLASVPAWLRHREKERRWNCTVLQKRFRNNWST
jgi:hypothetical protein